MLIKPNLDWPVNFYRFIENLHDNFFAQIQYDSYYLLFNEIFNDLERRMFNEQQQYLRGLNMHVQKKKTQTI